MRRTIPVALDTCAAVALAVWLGGLLACWLLLAPSLREAPAVQPIFEQVLRRFSAVAEACGVILVAVQWVLRRRYQKIRTLYIADGVRMLGIFVALFFAEYGRYVLIPTLLRSGSTDALATLTALAMVQAALLVGYAALTGWLQSRPAG
jgi:cytosine/uracil/thiamine/allantoin permease